MTVMPDLFETAKQAGYGNPSAIELTFLRLDLRCQVADLRPLRKVRKPLAAPR